MPVTKLDTTAALIVIDLQKGITGLPTVHPAGEIIGRTAQLARFPRARAASRSRERDGRGSGSYRRRKAQVFASR
jgi:nicotinamidase-related amidase